MSQRHVVIGSSVGLHARPASLFVQAASRQPVKITIAKVGAEPSEPVDARSILSVLALDARNGDEVVLTADGEGESEDAALGVLAALLERDLDAEP